jgi:hypothetical protein
MLAVYDTAIAEQLDFASAARWTLVALLQAPQFLFRMDDEIDGVPGEPRDLNGYELAARLAAFLWVSVPDEALLAAAADQSLLQAEVLDAQVQRMLADPKAQRFTETFAIDFSRARLASVEGSTDADRAALNESVIATFQDHFWTQQGSLAGLFQTTRFAVNPTVAGLRGMQATGVRLESVDAKGLRLTTRSEITASIGMGNVVARRLGQEPAPGGARRQVATRGLRKAHWNSGSGQATQSRSQVEHIANHHKPRDRARRRPVDVHPAARRTVPVDVSRARAELVLP